MSPPASSRLDWFLFILLGFLWGSSYLFIKIGVDAGLQPFTLVTLRLLIGLALLAVVVAVAREALPRERRTYGHLVVMGFFSVALPFMLITWAEQSVDSSLAAVLTAAVPLFVIPFAALILRDESTSSFTIEDLQSTNGTKVNGKRVRSSELRPGDTLQIGSTIFEFVREG